MRAGCGLAGPGPTRATRGERRSRRRWIRKRGTEPTEGGEGSAALSAGQWGGAPSGLELLGRLCGPLGRGRFGAACLSASQPGPRQRGPGRRPSSSRCSACPCQALVAKFSTAQPSSDGQTLISWPPPATGPFPRRDGFPPAGALLPVRSAEARGTPVVAARRVLSWGPRPLSWRQSSAPPRRLAWPGAALAEPASFSGKGASRSREGADARGAET